MTNHDRAGLAPAQLAGWPEPLVAKYQRRSTVAAERNDGAGAFETSIDRQTRDNAEHADALVALEGGEVIAAYTDNGKSAYRLRANRPQFAAMIDAVEAGRINTIVVWRADRLARSWDEWAKVLPLVGARKLRVIGVKDRIDTIDAKGRADLGRAAERAREESDVLSERLTAAHDSARRTGRMRPTGKRGFGHDTPRNADGTIMRGAALVLVEAEAERVREAVRRLLAGDTPGMILRDWRAAGVVGTGGKPMSRHTFGRVVTSARIAGCRDYQGALVASPGIPPIVTESDLWAVRAIMAGRSVRHPGPRVGSLLAGVVVCGSCGHVMTASGARGRYRCVARPERPHCGRVSVAMATADDVVAEVVRGALKTREAAEAAKAEAPVPGTPVAYDALLAELDAELGRLAVDRRAGRIVEAEAEALRDAIMAERHELHLARAGAARAAAEAPVPASALVEAWGSGDLARRREVVRRLLAEVRVHPVGKGGGTRAKGAGAGRPGVTPDRSRVEPVWRAA